MMKKVICLVLIVALSLILPPASAHADSSSENLTQAIRPADTFVQPLSEMSESECIEFIKSYGVAIPNIYENESECGSFVKWVITALESDLYRPMAISYTINAEFAENIRSAIIEYYQTTNTVTNYTMDNTLIPKDALDDSSVYGAWDDQFTKYNCYSYVLGYTAAFIDPGLFSAEDPNSYYLNINTDIFDIALLVKSDLEFLGHERVVLERDSMNTSNLCTNEKIMCVRKGDDDYHFMQYYNGMWLHKPGNTHILKYNYTPSFSRIWTNELSWYGTIYDYTTTYTSDIYFISYNGHDWEYAESGNGDGTHSKTCDICQDEIAVKCTYNYSMAGVGAHTGTCTVCGDTVTEDCMLESSYFDTGAHRSVCTLCGLAFMSYCDFINTYCGNATSGDMHIRTCPECGQTEGSASACSMTYTFYGNVSGVNKHRGTCSVCGHVQSTPSACTYSSGRINCTLCGMPNLMINGIISPDDAHTID